MSDRRYMIQIDGLRAIAVGGVMFSHWMTIIPWMRNFGYFLGPFGVNLFFVISGFLITQILIQSKEKEESSNRFILRQFYVRRFLRIFPLYYFSILIGAILAIPEVRHRLYWFIFYLVNWLIGIKGSLEAAGFYTHLWSLAVEEQFYIFFPFVFLTGYAKHWRKILIALLVTGVLSRAGILLYGLASGWGDLAISWPAYVVTPCCMDSFAAGALLAIYKFHQPGQTLSFLRKKYVRIISAVSLFLVFLAKVYPVYPVCNDLYIVFGRFLYALSGVWVVGLASYSEFKDWVKRLLENSKIVFLGKISYGLYDYHVIILYLMGSIHVFHSVRLDFFATRSLFLLVTILVASASWFIIEKPLNDLKKHFSYKENLKRA
jgi:peptidoglycan/LPS O-acetylase OafA/YrhL